MRYPNAAIYRWSCRAVAIGYPFCILTLILLLAIVSLFACTMMEAQSLAESNAREVGGPAESSSPNSSTNRSAVQDEHWNMSAAQKDASSEAGTHQVNGDRQDGRIHSWLPAVDTARASQPHFVAPIVTTHVMLVQQYRWSGPKRFLLPW
jgi:predicted lipid-binding transport protein (Tim44 family)